MADDQVCDDMIVLLQNDTLPCNPLWVPSSSAALQGGESMVNFENVGAGDSADESQFFQQAVKEETEDDDFDLGVNQRGKKRRLSATQVQFLERTFEVENKLEPERKIQLAKELGLQPRQVAVWFQNRRARFKNKQLEKDYDSLKSSYDKLKLDYDNLLKEKENLNNQVVALKEKLGATEEKEENSEAVKMGSAKQENAIAAVTTSSGKSDVLDTDSPDSFLGPVDSCQVFESDFSHEEEDEFSRSFLPQQFYSKVYHEPAANSTSFELSGEDQAFWSWGF